MMDWPSARSLRRGRRVVEKEWPVRACRCAGEEERTRGRALEGGQRVRVLERKVEKGSLDSE